MEGETYLTLNAGLEKHSSISLVPTDKNWTGNSISTTNNGNEPSSDTTAASVVTSSPPALPLQYTWCIWEQVYFGGGHSDYKETTRKIATFSTVHEFWKLFQSLPQPSELMTAKRMIREEGGTQPIDAIMIFREGIEPMWEDPKNAVGGHFDYKVSAGVLPAQADEYWNNLVLGIIGGTLRPAGMVTGLRMVDKMERNMIRFELWYTAVEEPSKMGDATRELQQSAANLMASKLDGSTGRPLEGLEKSHKRRR